MNDSDPTEPELLASLRADFTHPGPEVRARVSSRLAHSVGSLALSGVSPTSPTSPASWISGLRGHSLGLIASFVLGGASGAGLFAALQRPPARERVYVDRPIAQAVPVAIASATPEPLSEPVLAASAAPKPAAVSSAPRAGAGLAEQQALLDVARSAFGSGDYQRTLQVLSTHSRRFPKSVLTEEREALEIKALAGSGLRAQAKARATGFALRFPQSLLMPSINESANAIP